MSILDYTTRHKHEVTLRRVTEKRFDVFIDTLYLGYADEVDRRWTLSLPEGQQISDNDSLSGLLGWLDLVIDAHEGDESARQLCEIAAGGRRPGDRLWASVPEALP